MTTNGPRWQHQYQRIADVLRQRALALMPPPEVRALEAWAEALAAQLPLFTAAEAAEVGGLAARLDARRGKATR